MSIVAAAFLLWLTWAHPVQCGGEATDDDSHPMIERINQRYDDFFRRQRELQAEDAQRERKAQDIKKVRLEHDRAMEEARRRYVLSRRKVSEDPRLERDWLAHEKALKQENDQYRRRFVKRKQAVEEISRRGRRIPGNKEYDLED